MSYNVVFTSLADRDLMNAVEWYDAQKQLLGWEFRDEVNDCIEKIMDDRVEYQRYSDDIHKIKLSRFPFDIYYLKSTKQKYVVIMGVFHFKRNPEEIRRLLG